MAIFSLFSVAEAGETNLGSFVITVKGQLGVIRTEINSGSVFLRVIEQNNRSEKHLVNNLVLTQSSITTPLGILIPGDIIKLQRFAMNYKVLALFENGKILIAPLNDALRPSFRPKYDARSANLIEGSALQKIIGNASQGSYVLTPTGKLGTLREGINSNPKLGVRLPYKSRFLGEEHTLRELILTVNSKQTSAGLLTSGSFVFLKGSEKTIYVILAIFENGQIIAAKLSDTANSLFKPTEKHLMALSNVQQILGDKDFFQNFITKVQDNVENDLNRLTTNLQSTLLCLEQNQCHFTIQYRRAQEGNLNTKPVLENFNVTDSESLFKILRMQAVQYKVYAGLANADILAGVNKVYPDAPYTSVYPLPGLTAISFKNNEPAEQFVSSYVQLDISMAKHLMESFFNKFGVTQDHPENIFETSRVCNQGNCEDMPYYGDFVRPIYQGYLRELSESQPFLNFLNWKLDKKDFIQALKATIREAGNTKKFMRNLKDEERLLMFSFTTSVEQEITNLTQPQRDLISQITRQYEAQNTLIKQLGQSIQKPEFWGIVACYGVSAVTPLKFTHLLCHAAGLVVTVNGIFNSVQNTKNLFSVQKLGILDPKAYHDAVVSLAIESTFAILFLRATVPDFTKAFQQLSKTASAKALSTVGASNINQLLHNKEAAAKAQDQVMEVLQKLALSKVFVFTATTPSLMKDLFLHANDSYESRMDQVGGDLYLEELLTPVDFFTDALLTNNFSSLPQESLDAIVENHKMSRKVRLLFLDAIEKSK